MQPITTPYEVFFDLDGKPLDGGYIYFGEPNQNPQTSPITVYFDEAGTQPSAQPLRTSQGYIYRNGSPANIFIDGSYSISVFDKKMRLVYYKAVSLSETSIVSVEGFGAVGYATAAEALAGIDSTAQINNAVASITSGVVEFKSRFYKCSGTIQQPPGILFVGEGSGRWSLNTTEIDENGTNLMFVGTGTKDKTVDHISDMNTGGGVVANPAYGQAGISPDLSQDYSLYNFTNADAVGTTRATLKPFSVGVHLLPGGGGGLENIRVVVGHSTRGLDIYTDNTYTGLADDWDVGIWIDNRTQYRVVNSKAVGYWRAQGTLVSCVAKNSSDVPSAEFGYFEQYMSQGFRGIAFRGPDKYKVTAVTPTTIEIGWSNSHTFATSGVLRSGTSSYTYTGLSFSGDKLTFTGIADTTGVVVGDGVVPRNDLAFGNYGFSGTSLNRCNFAGLAHASRLMATSPNLSTPFTYASSDLEISGDSLREIRFDDSTFLCSDEVAVHMHDCNDVQFTRCYGEGQTARTLIGGAFNIPAGARIIASPKETTSTRSTYPCGETGQLRISGCDWNESLDFTPTFPSSNINRFGAYGGLFDPRSIIGFKDDANDSAQVQYAPSGDSVKMGPSDGDLVLESNFGAVDIRSATTSDPVRVRVGSTTVVDYSSTGFTFGASIANPVISTNNGELDLRAASGSLVRLRTGSTTVAQINTTNATFTVSSAIRPNADNATSAGDATHRYSVVYAGTGAINTSDEREKQQIGPIDPAVLRAWAKVEYCQFKFNDAIESKGSGARWHFGVIAQRVKEAFESEGLDPFAYGLLCYDEWEDEFEPVPATRTVVDEDGNEYEQEYVTGEMRLARAAGNRYGIRYDEAIVLECAYLRSKS